MLTLFPYLFESTVWVFDDERTGLKEEAFVLGMTEMISRLVEHKRIPDASTGFALSFSDQPFVGFDAELRWIEKEGQQVVPDMDGNASPLTGNWYRGIVVGQEMEGWLCPALGLYFVTAPLKIFVRADPLPPGVNPIWQPPPGDVPRRFVSAKESGS